LPPLNYNQWTQFIERKEGSEGRREVKTPKRAPHQTRGRLLGHREDALQLSSAPARLRNSKKRITDGTLCRVCKEESLLFHYFVTSNIVKE
jgi:hypothetical protein